MSIAGYTYSGFKLIDFNSDNWHEDDWYNWTLLDSMFQASFGDVPLPVVGGTANAITLDFVPDRPLINGLAVVFIPTASPTGATTIDVDGQGAKPLIILGNPVVAGDFLAGEPVKAIYDGTQFNTVAPLKKFSQINIVAGPSGATPDVNANDLTISNNSNAGINILTPSANYGILGFGDPGNALAGYVKYNHATDILSFGRDGADAVTVDNVGFYLPTGRFGMNVTGANDFIMTESAANVMRLGSSGATNGLNINLTSGLVTALNGLTVTGVLTATSIVGTVNVGTVTGVLALANGGTGAATAPLARDNLGLLALATKDKVNDGDWLGTALALVNGGTGATTASQARINLGIVPGTDVQPIDADLTAIAALTTTPYGRGFLTLANAVAALDYVDGVSLVSASFGTNTINLRLGLPDGTTVMIQGGTGTLAGNTLATVTFPVPYSIAPVALVNGGASNVSDTGEVHAHQAATTTGIAIVNSTATTGTYNWIAIGKL